MIDIATIARYVKMPKKLMDCVRELMKKGHDQSSAYAICEESTGWKRKKGGGGWRNDKTGKGYKGK
jgi:hypothetical protein